MKYLWIALILCGILQTDRQIIAAAKYPYVLEHPEDLAELVSPNGRFSVWLERQEIDFKYSIRDQKTSAVQNIVDCESSKVEALYWTGDSRTIVAICRQPDERRAYVIHLNKNGDWISTEVKPASGGIQHETQIKCTPLEREIHFDFAIAQMDLLDNPGDVFYCGLNFDPHSGAFSGVTWDKTSTLFAEP